MPTPDDVTTQPEEGTEQLEEALNPLPQTDPLDGEDLKHESCMEEAWRLLANGVYSFRAIARGVNAKTGCIHDGKWVKRTLVRHGGMIEETIESGAIPSRAKYLQALYERRAGLAGIAVNQQARDSDRVAAYRAMIECDEKIAAAEGVITERRGMAHSGEEGKPPVRVQQVPIFAEEDALNHFAPAEGQAAPDGGGDADSS